MYFPDMRFVRPLRHVYGYATAKYTIFDLRTPKTSPSDANLILFVNNFSTSLATNDKLVHTYFKLN